MRATIKQAEKNENNLSILTSGHGYWKISMTFRKKDISVITTNSIAVDDFKSEFGELDMDKKNRRLMGYIDLCEEIISKHYN